MISVCLTTFNGALYITSQLISILDQLSATDEVLIADDGSTDDTLEKIISLNDERIRFVARGGNLGVVKNFERVLLEAKGEYVFLCDQDDIWLPGKVRQCVSALHDSLLVVTDCKVVDENLEEIMPSFFTYRNSGPGILKNICINSFLGCCMAFRQELLTIALPIPVSVPMHDMWLGLLANVCGEVKFLPVSLSLYRRHTTNVSSTAVKSNNSYWVMLKYRLILISQLTLRVIFRTAVKK